MEAVKNILVTGGCGFIGTHLCHSLVKAGHRVRILDDLSTGKAAMMPTQADLMIGNVNDPETAADAMAGMDGVIHLAAIASVERCNQAWVKSHQTNLGGTLTIMEAARDAAEQPVPVVWASSAAIYGAAKTFPITERTPTAPMSPYGADKLGGELHGQAAAEVFGLPNTALRFFNVFGPGQDPSSPYSGVISIFADRLGKDLPVTIYGDGKQTRDFVYVGDVVRALEASLARLMRRQRLEHEASFDAINVCTGRAVTVQTLAETLGELLGSTHPIGYGETRNGDIRDSVGDPSKMQRLLSMRAETSFEDGLRALIGSGAERVASAG